MSELTFSVDSALLSELGEKLVESPHIALVELVKNAYDADATSVTVKIRFTSTGPDIQIADNGSGMTFQEVEKYWMRIATTHKTNNNLSPRYGRPRTGSKGIGRFACRRLGTNLHLDTTAQKGNSFEQTTVFFPWLEFVAGGDITEIGCEGEKQTLKNSKAGTILTITGGLDDQWDRRGYNYLKRQLAVLTANRGSRRKGFEDDPGFKVKLEAPGFEDPIENLRDDLLTAGWGDLSIEVKKGGTVTYKLDAMKVGQKTINHPEKFPALESVTAKIGIMPSYTRDELRRKDILSKTNLKEIVDDWGGVFVRLKGFRVYPYGEKRDDWLRIERDRGLRATSLPPILQPFAAGLKGVNPSRALLALLSNRSYIGDVEIGELAAKEFEPKASREGFIENEAFEQLREIIRFGIDWSTIYREYFKGLTAQGEAEKAREDLEVQLKKPVESKQIIDSAIRLVETEVKSMATRLPTAERQQILRSIKSATNAIAKHEASNAEERRHLQLVASTSSLLLIFSHEVKALLSWFEQVRISLGQIRAKVEKSEAEKLLKIEDDFGDTKNRLLDLLSMTSLISVTRKTEPERLTLLPRIQRATQAFNLIISGYSIEVDLSLVNRAVQVGPIMEAELFAVLLNLLSNSIKSVIAAGKERKIQLEASRIDGKVKLHLRDNGMGLREKDFESVFHPFVADPDNQLYSGLSSLLNPEDEYIVGTGSGLGLSIAREILESRGGHIKFVKPTNDWKADVEVTLA